MPQADDDLRDRMVARFGDIDDSGPCDALKAAGYTLRKDWSWAPKPGVKTYRDMTREEFDCLLFLVHEWDYAGLASPEELRPTTQEPPRHD